MKKVTYKIEQFKSITFEVETEEQEKQIEELNRDFERTDRQDRRIKAKTESLDQMYEETGNEPVDEGESPEELMMLKLEKEKVRNALNKIRPRYRTAIEIIFWQGKTQREAAMVLGIKENTFSELLQRALIAFKKEFQKN